MLDFVSKKDGTVARHYECTVSHCVNLCMANIECLLRIALMDSDEHIRQLGGEKELLNLMNGYVDLMRRLKLEDLGGITNGDKEI